MPIYGYDPATYPLNQNEWSFPVTEILHIIGFIILIGTIVIVDLRLLGVGMRRQTSAELVKDTAPWTLLGLVMIVITGPMIFLSDPVLYLYNEAFRFKITMLIVCIIFNWTLHRKVANAPDPGSMGPVIGGLSMLMWASLIYAGIFIAFV
jgi:hypothetical protein